MTGRLVATSGPDGGWGWVIVFAVFMGNVLIEGTAVALFGLLYPELLSAFKETPAMTSLAGSMIVGVYLFISHFVGSLVQRFGCRVVCFMGGCVAAGGLLLSMTSQSMLTFILTYGVIGGCGLGLNSLPGNIMVNLYFNRRRGIAQGIVASGAGCGVLIIAPLTQILLDAYGWRGTMLIMAGINLQFCVFACLMRPVSENEVTDSNNDSESSQDVMLKEKETEPTDPHGDCKYVGDHDEEKVPLQNKRSNTIEIHIASPQLRYSEKELVNKMFSSVLESELKNEPTGGSLHNIKTDTSAKSNRHKSNMELNQYDKNVDNNSKYLNSLPNLHLRLPHGHSERALKHNHHHHHSHHIVPMSRKDIFYSGSLYRLKEFTSQSSIQGFVQAMTTNKDTESSSSSGVEEDPDSCCCHHALTTIGSVGKHLKDCSVLKTKIFIPILIGAVLIQMSQFIPTTFVGDYGLQHGIKPSQISIILGVYGGMNVLGRLSAGFIAYLGYIQSIWLCNFGVAMCGVCCVAFPWCTSMTSLCIFAASLGYFIGYFVPLQILIIVDYVGLDKLTSSLGFLQMVKGPAALIGPPIAGLIYQWTSSYGMSVVFSAGLFFLAAGVQSLVPLLNRKCLRAGSSPADKDQPEDQHHPAETSSNDLSFN